MASCQSLILNQFQEMQTKSLKEFLVQLVIHLNDLVAQASGNET